ncbi:hypothetical protein ES705_43768 [subsurface metagenome]
MNINLKHLYLIYTTFILKILLFLKHILRPAQLRQGIRKVGLLLSILFYLNYLINLLLLVIVSKKII